MSKLIEAGNADIAGENHRGWIMGDFIDFGIRKTDALELKFSHHPAGDHSEGEKRTDCRTLTMLIAGKMAVELAGVVYTLSEQGDYVAWNEGIEHQWMAEEDTTMFTVRWRESA